jgi:hypothetical protein
MNEQADTSPSFSQELEELINRHCRENLSNTPDFLLAEFMQGCLRVYESTTRQRDKWYGVTLSPASSHFEPGHYSERRDDDDKGDVATSTG